MHEACLLFFHVSNTSRNAKFSFFKKISAQSSWTCPHLTTNLETLPGKCSRAYRSIFLAKIACKALKLNIFADPTPFLSYCGDKTDYTHTRTNRDCRTISTNFPLSQATAISWTEGLARTATVVTKCRNLVYCPVDKTWRSPADN